jgi:hypothetical protein
MLRAAGKKIIYTMNRMVEYNYGLLTVEAR